MTNPSSRLRRSVRRAIVPPTGARRHLAPGLDLDDFFESLNRRGVSYAVLRWFDDLPHVDPGEDVDLLVADDDLAFVHSLMAGRAVRLRGQPFDIYSVSGLPGSDFRGVPYYPPSFAASLLERSVKLRGRYSVPSLQDHFDSLAYHAVYHKGYAAGLTPAGGDAEGQSVTDHDYAAVLTSLAGRLGLAVPPVLESLDSYLAERGLRPPLDTLERLQQGNPWIRDRFLSDKHDVDEVWRGLAVFVLRERAQDKLDVAVDELDRRGFEILDVVVLTPDQTDRARHRLRGGNWARGPWPVSGGAPSTFVLAYDVAPDVSGPGHGADNLRIARAKEHLRTRLLDGTAPAERYNPVHSSDNPGQALDYLEALNDPTVQDRVRTLVQQLLHSVAFPYPVLEPLGGAARRAQVAIVQHPVVGPSVCKVFRPAAVRFLDREVRARKELPDLGLVPDLIESGESWLLTPLYTDDGSHVRRAVPGLEYVQLTVEASRALATFALALHERGLFLLDLSTSNLLSDPVAGLKIIDLEFLQEYAGARPQPQQSYTFWGVPPGVGGYDEPIIRRRRRQRGPGRPATRPNSAFHPAVTGSSVKGLLQPDRLLDRQRRQMVQWGWCALLLQHAKYMRLRASWNASSSAAIARAVARLVSHAVQRR